MTSSPLFIIEAESMVIFWPMLQFGCFSACVCHVTPELQNARTQHRHRHKIISRAAATEYNGSRQPSTGNHCITHESSHNSCSCSFRNLTPRPQHALNRCATAACFSGGGLLRSHFAVLACSLCRRCSIDF